MPIDEINPPDCYLIAKGAFCKAKIAGRDLNR
jgi:hypothetical protein